MAVLLAELPRDGRSFAYSVLTVKKIEDGERDSGNEAQEEVASHQSRRSRFVLA